MPDSKITALPELVAPDVADVLAIVDDPAGSAVTSKITLANLLSTPAMSSLAAVLGVGNTTGGTDIEITSGDALTAPAGIDLRLLAPAGQVTDHIGNLQVWHPSEGAGDFVSISHDSSNGSISASTGLVISGVAGSLGLVGAAGSVGNGTAGINVARAMAFSAGLGAVSQLLGPNDQDLEITAFQQNADLPARDFRILGGSALASAVTNEDGGSVRIIPGANATGGGTDGSFFIDNPIAPGVDSSAIEMFTAASNATLRYNAVSGVFNILSGLLLFRADATGQNFVFRPNGFSNNQDLTFGAVSGDKWTMATGDAIGDAVPIALKIRGGSAFASAVTNRDGANIDIVPGANATGGGTDGVLQVFHPDEAAGDFMSIEHNATNGIFRTGSGEMQFKDATAYRYTLANSEVTLFEGSASLVFMQPAYNEYAIRPGNGGDQFLFDNLGNLVFGTGRDIGLARDGVGILRVTDGSTGVKTIKLQDVISQDATTDVAVTDMRIEAADALAAAVTNQDGAMVEIIPGANATGGGVDGRMRVLHPDEGAFRFVDIWDDGSVGRVTVPGNGEMLIGPEAAGTLNFGAATGRHGVTSGASGPMFSALFQLGGSSKIVVMDSTVIPAVGLASNIQVGWSSTGLGDGTKDIGLARDSAGVLRVTDGTTGVGDLITSALESRAGRIVNTTRITASPYAVLATDHVIYLDTDGGVIVANLPAGVVGTTYKIINVGGSANDVTLNPNGAELLFGANSSTAITDGTSVTITFEGTEGWW